MYLIILKNCTQAISQIYFIWRNYLETLSGFTNIVIRENDSGTHYQQYIMSSHHMHCGGIWDLTQVYLGQKLAIELLFQHPSQFQGQVKFKMSYSVVARTQDCCVRNSDSRRTLLQFFPVILRKQALKYLLIIQLIEEVLDEQRKLDQFIAHQVSSLLSYLLLSFPTSFQFLVHRILPLVIYYSQDGTLNLAALLVLFDKSRLMPAPVSPSPSLTSHHSYITPQYNIYTYTHP